jgi:hypothetical protein
MVPKFHELPIVDDGYTVAQALHYFQHVRGQEHGGAAADLIQQDVLRQPGTDPHYSLVCSCAGAVGDGMGKRLLATDEGR